MNNLLKLMCVGVMLSSMAFGGSYKITTDYTKCKGLDGKWTTNCQSIGCYMDGSDGCYY
ncbi:MAG: hypothetical protein P8L77_05790 [Gammaproteobacteria bacterium]|nr:hypothetical protein [Gammaproteobacteria bacterium]